MLKRRYRSTEENEKLRRLEYFNQPFEPGNEIRLIDDIDLEKPLALESLATQFEAVDSNRGKTNNVMERTITDSQPKKGKNKANPKSSDFGYFTLDKHTY